MRIDLVGGTQANGRVRRQVSRVELVIVGRSSVKQGDARAQRVQVELVPRVIDVQADGLARTTIEPCLLGNILRIQNADRETDRCRVAKRAFVRQVDALDVRAAYVHGEKGHRVVSDEVMHAGVINSGRE